MKQHPVIPSRLLLWVVAITCALTALPVWSAQTVHLRLKANGTDIPGDSTVTSLERENTIECLSYSEEVYCARDLGGMATGRRIYLPITLTKRVDRSSPLLIKALTNNEVLEAEFRFYRPSPSGDGTEQHFFTVRFSGGRVNSIRRISPDVLDPVTKTRPVIEEVSFQFMDITWTYLPTGAEHHDSWTDIN